MPKLLRIIWLPLAVALCLWFAAKTADYGEARKYFQSFLPTDSIVIDSERRLLWKYPVYSGDDWKYLKIADKLKFEEEHRVEICLTEVAGRTLNYEILNTGEYAVKEGMVRLLKNIDGAWYWIYSGIIYNMQRYMADGFTLPGNSTKGEICLGMLSGYATEKNSEGSQVNTCYIIPEGRYALIVQGLGQDIEAREENGELIAYCGGLVEFDLRHNEIPGAYVTEDIFQFAYSGSYEIENISKTLYLDPYA